MSKPISPSAAKPCPVALAVLWIDWYAYHVARFEGLLSIPELAGRVAGVEFVGGIGVHAGLKFREPLPPHLPVTTLLPEASWQQVSQLRVAGLVWRHLTHIDPGAVLVPGYYTLPAIAAAIWARVHHRPSILMTESTAFDHTRVAWKEVAKSFLLRLLFDAAVTGGTAHRHYLEQLHFPMDHVVGGYDVVDNAAIAAGVDRLRSTVSAMPKQPSFLYVGRLSPEKNLSVLVAAWIAYRNAGGTWPLILVGDGPCAADLRAQAAASLFSSEIVFEGLRGSRELPAFYARAGCFVLPSSREPWGLVVNEAMAAGLPVLVSDRCGCAEDLVRSGRNGFTFPPHATDELSRLLQTVEELPRPDRISMGEESRRIIATYTPQHFGRQIACLLAKDHDV